VTISRVVNENGIWLRERLIKIFKSKGGTIRSGFLEYSGRLWYVECRFCGLSCGFCKPDSDHCSYFLMVIFGVSYHIAGTKGIYYAREPYTNVDAVHITRFIGLASVGNRNKQVCLLVLLFFFLYFVYLFN